MGATEVVIEAKGLTKKYDDFTAVDDIDFKVYKGECVGFLGPNGAGKTTIVRMIYCFFHQQRKLTLQASVPAMPK
jgi:lipooligosaccharide transport system ATP-binding protein